MKSIFILSRKLMLLTFYDRVSIGKNVVIQFSSKFLSKISIGDNTTIGHHCIIGKNVQIGKNVVIKNFVEIRDNTVIEDDCYIDSYVAISGNCTIHYGVTLRYGAIIARGAEIGAKTYICPRVMTNNLDENRNQIGGAKIGAECFIGTHTVINHGIIIEDRVTIGANSYVNKNCEKDSVYYGTPARKEISNSHTLAMIK